MTETETHIYFYTNQFSNWDRCTVIDPFDKTEFFTSEHAFMYQKAKFFQDERAMERLLVNPHPRDAKKIGREVQNYDEEAWNKVRFYLMYEVNFWKFSGNADYKKLLLSTGDKTLVEASTYDLIWGVGLGENDPLILDEANWRGQNLLGYALMEVRATIRDEEFYSNLVDKKQNQS